jgi:hypothetical protein
MPSIIEYGQKTFQRAPLSLPSRKRIIKESLQAYLQGKKKSKRI